ncbi:ABC molybdate transporter, periplasmic ligand binding protein [Caballeronia choica]|jgi:molybdate transport system substrate-binding protein|uniref:ABC molybdate transporter, periplasmic ligand binding protein n=1 Tax=Caballeronia choica TaxID=326476 RepID=A0A158KPW0_9BURK|nr:substrate-binding domain-containing protein [Caballeronia choica]SAL83172.1 ABC molybdate transporter, periplasmic ligand binding protein [Caballeronia choica]
MNARLKRVSLSTFLAVSLSMFTATVQAANIMVMSDSPLEPALTKVVDLYRQQTHNQVILAFAPSPVVKKRIEGGETADVVIVQPDFAEDLTKSGKVNAGERPIIAHVGVGLGNRKDAPAYDISTVEKLKNTLLGADLIVFNSVKSGQAFANTLERLGIAETLKPKILRTAPNDIFEAVLKGKGNDMVAGTIPLIATTPGIKLLGPLPGDLQSTLTYTAVLSANTLRRDSAERFIRFLMSPQATEIFAANGAK